MIQLFCLQQTQNPYLTGLTGIIHNVKELIILKF